MTHEIILSTPVFCFPSSLTVFVEVLKCIKGSQWADLFSLSVLALSEAGHLSSIRDRWWPTPGDCPRASPLVLAPPAPVTLDLYHLAPPFIFLWSAILLAIMVVFIEIFSDKTISSKTKYIKRKVFRLHECKDKGYPPALVCHVATQTILWASSRAASPSPGLSSNLSKKLYTSDGQIARI